MGASTKNLACIRQVPDAKPENEAVPLDGEWSNAGFPAFLAVPSQNRSKQGSRLKDGRPKKKPLFPGA